MRVVLGISTVLGLIGVVAAFGLFYLGERVFHLDRVHIQTLMYLKLSVAGHLTIFLTRTRGPFWSIRPVRVLWAAVVGTQAVATLIAVYGLFMTPLGWGWAGFVWAYALAWFLLNDRVKLLAYRILDPVKAKTMPEAKPDAKIVPTAEPKAAPKPAAELEPKPEAKTEPAREAEAETEPGAKAEPKPGAKAGAEAKPAVEPEPEVKTLQPRSEIKVEAQPEAKAKTTSDLTRQIATRAYELYEQQGRRDGQSGQSGRFGKIKPRPNPSLKPRSSLSLRPKLRLKPRLQSSLNLNHKSSRSRNPRSRPRLMCHRSSSSECASSTRSWGARTFEPLRKWNRRSGRFQKGNLTSEPTRSTRLILPRGRR